MQISKDTDVPRPNVIGFFIPLAQLKNLIVKSLTGQKVDAPEVQAPEPEGNEEEVHRGRQEHVIVDTCRSTRHPGVSKRHVRCRVVNGMRQKRDAADSPSFPTYARSRMLTI